MTEDLDLWLRKFIVAIPHDVLEEYFTSLMGRENLPSVIAMNDQVVRRILGNPKNTQLRTLVADQLAQAYKLSHADHEFLEKICQEQSVRLRRGAEPPEIAAILLIRHPEVFAKALALYSYRTIGGAMSDYYVPVSDPGVIEKRLPKFQRAVAKRLKVGDDNATCHAKTHHDGARVLIAVTTGEHVKPMAYWSGRKVTVKAFRPARQDTLVYDTERSLLSVGAPLQGRLRHFYLEAFCEQIVGDAGLARQALDTEQFSLEPILAGTFSLAGSEQVQKVAVIEVSVLDVGAGEARITVRSDNAMLALRARIDAGLLHPQSIESARIQFWAPVKGQTVHNIVTIRPPRGSDLADKRLREVIIPYLKAQGVMKS